MCRSVDAATAGHVGSHGILVQVRERADDLLGDERPAPALPAQALRGMENLQMNRHGS